MLNNIPSQAEYIIYSYPRASKSNDNLARWTREMSSSDLDHVQSKAKYLFETRQFKKIEIQKKYFDLRQKKIKAKTFQIYGDTKSANYTILVMILLLSFISAGLFYLHF